MPDEGVVTQDLGWTEEATFEVVNSVHSLFRAVARPPHVGAAVEVRDRSRSEMATTRPMKPIGMVQSHAAASLFPVALRGDRNRIGVRVAAAAE
jgi:hypothetical protein